MSIVMFAFLIYPVSCATIGVSNSNAPSGAIDYALINLSGMDDFGVADLDIYYNPNVVNIVTASLSFSGHGGSLTPNINNNIGKATFLILSTSIPGPNSPLTLLNLSLKGVGSEGQTSVLGLVVNTLADSTNGNPVNSTVNNGTFTVSSTTSSSTPPTSSNGGGAPSGGGGSGGISDENYTNIEFTEKYELYIYKDVATSYNFRKLTNPIVFVNITGNTNSIEITTSVEVLRGTSTLVKSPPPELIYKNINIWVGTFGYAIPKNIKNAEVTFKVPIEWMEANNIDQESIELMRYDDGWQSLPTRKIGTNNNNILYEASTIGFSSFAIIGKKVALYSDFLEKEKNNNPETIPNQQENQGNLNHIFWSAVFVGVVVIAIIIYKFKKLNYLIKSIKK